jgi:hypothetical protein
MRYNFSNHFETLGKTAMIPSAVAAAAALGEETVQEAPSTPEKGKEKKPEGRWALLTGIGSFLLYFFGYLSLRFHLSVLGVDTGLSVLDERYLFAGAQFLVYLVTSAPVALVLALIARFLWQRISSRLRFGPQDAILWGIALSIALIQFVMRQCLPFTNLLLRPELPAPSWVQKLLLDDAGILQPLYFSVLLACIAGLVWLLLTAGGWEIRLWPPLNWIFAILVLIQFLLLPVTFGILIADQDVPRVTTMDGKEMLKPDVQAWRVWEGKDSVTFLVRHWDKDKETSRSLVTLANKGVEKTEISGYDRILRLLHGWPGDGATGDESRGKTEQGGKQ